MRFMRRLRHGILGAVAGLTREMAKPALFCIQKLVSACKRNKRTNPSEQIWIFTRRLQTSISTYVKSPQRFAFMLTLKDFLILYKTKQIVLIIEVSEVNQKENI